MKIANKAISLQNRTGQVRVPVKVGQVVKALRYYRDEAKYLVVAQENSDKFLATVELENTNFLEQLASIYEERQKYMGRNVSNLPSLSQGSSSLPPLVVPKKEPVGANSVAPPRQSDTTTSNSANVVRGKAQNPQLSENILDSMPKPAKEEAKVDTSDHGANCVCKDCRVKKIGKGSLFPDL